MSEDLPDAKGYLGELGRSLLHARTIRVMGDWSHREAEKCGERRRTRQSATVLFTPLNSPHRQDTSYGEDGEAGTGHHHFHENGIPGGFAPYRERVLSSRVDWETSWRFNVFPEISARHRKTWWGVSLDGGSWPREPAHGDWCVTEAEHMTTRS